MIWILNEDKGIQPSFFSILTADVRYDERLSSAEKVFYSEITSRTNALGYCYTSNNTFANLYKKDVRTITRWITELQKLNYIDVEYVRNEVGLVTQRKIFLSKFLGIDKNVQQYRQKCQRDIDKNVQYNNILYNNITHTYIEQEKIKYADKVYMTKNEHLKIEKEFGKNKSKKYIEKLNLHKLSSGKEYNSDYATIKKWLIIDNEKISKTCSKKNAQFSQRQYENKDLEHLYANIKNDEIEM